MKITCDLIGLFLGLAGLIYASYSNKLLARGVKSSALSRIRVLVNRLEEEKNKLEQDSPEWKTMHHSQQELEALFNDLRKIFSIKEKE